MRQGQLLEKQSIDKMQVLCIAFKDILIPFCSRHLPCVVVQGRYDVVCPVSPALSISDQHNYFL